MPCPFASALGQPGEGVHAHRLGPFAAIDLILTAVAAGLIARVRKGSALHAIGIFAALMILSLAVHMACGVDTAAGLMWVFSLRPYLLLGCLQF
jgi:hypothetical protein